MLEKLRYALDAFWVADTADELPDDVADGAIAFVRENRRAITLWERVDGAWVQSAARKEDLDQVRSRVDSVDSRAGGLKARADTLEAQMADLDARLTALEGG